jgi:hypothetical protein
MFRRRVADYPFRGCILWHSALVSWPLCPLEDRVWTGSRKMWFSLRDELREIVWLVMIIGGLSIMGVGLAVMLAQT